jgi:glycosyltransferase involved in cell wall biosynthesis
VNVLHVESSSSWGGQEYRTCLEINWLNAHGHQAWLMCDPQSEVRTRAQHLGTRLVDLPLRRRFNPLASFRIARFCRAHRIHLITAYSSKDHWLCLPLFFAGMPLLRARCVTTQGGHIGRAFIFKHGCSKVLADAEVVKQQLQHLGVAGEKIAVVGSAVDLARFRPDLDRSKFRREMGLSDETPLIVNIGMIRSDKGQMRLVRAAFKVLPQCPEARFVFVGKGTGEAAREHRMRDAIARSGFADRIMMVGYRWDTPEIIASADMVVISSLGTEASPIVLREAFACGRPVIATNIGDVAEVVHDGETGLLVPPNNIDALTTAIMRFLTDKALAERCAANALAFARAHFDFDQMVRAKLAVSLAVAGARSGDGRGVNDIDKLPETAKVSSVRR